MHSIETALARDFFRRGVLMFPAMLLMMIGLPLWLLAFVRFHDAPGEMARERVVLHVTLTLTMGFLAAVAVFQAQGKLARFFMRPISAARLVAIQMMLSAGTIALMYVCTASVLNLTGAGWPVLGPALFLGTAIACAVAAVWSLEGTVIGQFIGCTATSFPLAIWFSRCYGGRFLGDWNVMWQNPTAAEALTLVGIAAAAYGVAVFGVTRVRQGDMVDFAALAAWWERLRARGPAPPKFAHPMAGQLWCEWREKLTPAPACFVAAMVLAFWGAWLGGWMPVEEMLALMLAMPIVLLMLLMPMVYGLVAGSCAREGKTEMKHVLATRPVTDNFLASAMLRNCAAALAWAWGTWLVCLVIVVGLTYLAGYRAEVLSRFEPASFDKLSPLFVLLGGPLICWTFTALMACLVATGRPWVLVGTLFSLFTLMIVFILIRDFVSPAVFEVVTKICLALLGVVYAGGTAWAFIAAARLRLISSAAMLPVGAVWLLLSAAAVAVSFPQFPNPFWLIHCLGFLTLSILPFAAMPLAVRWNRHR
jgi:hypothetical protein